MEFPTFQLWMMACPLVADKPLRYIPIRSTHGNTIRYIPDAITPHSNSMQSLSPRYHCADTRRPSSISSIRSCRFHTARRCVSTPRSNVYTRYDHDSLVHFQQLSLALSWSVEDVIARDVRGASTTEGCVARRVARKSRWRAEWVRVGPARGITPRECRRSVLRCRVDVFLTTCACG